MYASVHYICSNICCGFRRNLQLVHVQNDDVACSFGVNFQKKSKFLIFQRASSPLVWVYVWLFYFNNTEKNTGRRYSNCYRNRNSKYWNCHYYAQSITRAGTLYSAFLGSFPPTRCWYRSCITSNSSMFYTCSSFIRSCCTYGRKENKETEFGIFVLIHITFLSLRTLWRMEEIPFHYKYQKAPHQTCSSIPQNLNLKMYRINNLHFSR